MIAELNEGDTYSPSQDNQFTLTDVHVTPESNQIRVIASAQLRAPESGDGVEYDGAPPRLGHSLDVATNRYYGSVTIRDVGRNRALPTESATVLVRDTISNAAASDVTAGDEIQLIGHTVATVENVSVYATNNSNQREVSSIFEYFIVVHS